MGLAPQWCQRLVFLCYVEHAPCWVSKPPISILVSLFSGYRMTSPSATVYFYIGEVLVTQCCDFCKAQIQGSNFACMYVLSRHAHAALGACFAILQCGLNFREYRVLWYTPVTSWRQTLKEISPCSKTVTVLFAMLLFCMCNAAYSS